MATKSKDRENDELISTLVPTKRRKNANRDTTNSDVCFVGKPLSATEASDRWPHRYQSKSKVKREEVAGSKEEGSKSEDKEVLQARCHYTQAMIDGSIYNLNDDAYVQAEDGKPDYIARIIELFEGIDRELYFTAQWFYRAEDTVIKDHAELIDKRRVFLSDVKDENPLNCIVSKVKIALVSPNVDLVTKEKTIPPCDLYYDMKYSLSYLTFANIVIDNLGQSKTENDKSSISSDTKSNRPIGDAIVAIEESKKSEMTLLDLYSGCGAMSTGLSIGAVISGVKLLPLINTISLYLAIKRWAVDINPHACESLRLNHAKTEEDDDGDEGSMVPDVDFEVQNLLAVCYGDPNKIKKPGLYFKVRWKGYGSSEDTWEPIEGLSQCKEKLKEFVTKGYKSKILPLPGDVDFICGGPPCQGVSGFNRFRNQEAPLDDVKNRQLLVFMDIIEHLKPRYVLMENVVDILKFAGGFLGRYAIGRLVSMNYQARLGMMAAGSYGLPQFRMREIHVGSVIDEHCMLQEALCLENAISDLPPVTNDESEDVRNYGTTARTEFQRYIRLKRNDMVSCMADIQSVPQTSMLYDHRPLKLSKDDLDRVCLIPKKKGANFRDLPGVLVGPDNKVEWDPSMERVMLPSGKPLVPEYAMSFVQRRGISTKPFGRLWWDEIVPTVVTRAEPHKKTLLHPLQDRVLTIRENARLQGFPDCYQLSGPVKERYIQVGNAVAFPVALALGYAFGLACQGLSNDQPVTTVPLKFPNCLARSSLAQT
ncbi:dna (cytosine-5)-methyltransferase 1 [Quercus suber]|uniref:DNA (cytosine-5-)-methyltransferase n=1 Tax=Quercus suber TaxID=58331 RepID=A0AAW0LTY3_QUESU